MTAPASTPRHRRARPVPPRLRDASDELGTYRFQVVAGNVADAVRLADEGFYTLV